ncbi:MAG: zinc ribbon domain-containing protein [Candidatus Bathyarchaeota archaeon]|nr:zinc ribbon domain-containing protein [Candidatus Bathyarchaeota archaeon]
MLKCPKCGKKAGDFYYCVECGTLLKEPCPGCGKWLDVTIKTCPKCEKPNRLYSS